ncbi:SDR family oxidoreductase [Glycomyces albus]
MRVFVTGASGFVGSAVVPELIGAGHEVVGLARSDRSAEKLAAAGAEVLRGDLEDLDSLHHGASETDGVVHLAFVHDFTNIEESGKTDLAAIEAMGEALAGTGKPLVITSGISSTPSGAPATEDEAPDPNSLASYRVPSDLATVALAERGVRSSVVRLPIVHDRDDPGFVPTLIGVAREKGVSAYVGDGSNRWAAVHRRDAARVFRLALESGEAGSRFLSVAESVLFRDIAEAIGKGAGVPVASISAEEAPEHYGWLSYFVLNFDVTVSSRLTRERLGWSSERHGLLADLAEGHYFE